MFRSYLSWRYLISRRTNLIGIAGVFVALCALIVIISIMTGFLEVSRQHIRGSLSDVVVAPNFPAGRLALDPAPMLEAVGNHPHVVASTAQIQWAGMILAQGRGSENIISNSTYSGLLFVQLVGVEVRSLERLAQPALRVLTASFGGIWAPYEIQDEFDATWFATDLEAGSAPNKPPPGIVKHKTPDVPPFPFVPPKHYRPRSRPAKGVVVGWQLADVLSLIRGDELRIATVVNDPVKGWHVNNRDFVVTDIFRTRDNETDRSRLYFERSELADFLGNTREYTHVLARLDDYSKYGHEVRDSLSASLFLDQLIARAGSPEVATWEDKCGNVLGAIENERVLMGIMLSLVLLVSSFTIFAILSMMVTEKRRDIGILRALGATPAGVRQLFLLIAFWDALVGAIGGTIAGVLIANHIDGIERWLSDLIGYQIFARDVYLFDHIPTIVPPVWVGAFVLGAFVFALLAALVPSWRASRIHPLDALRYE